jgi:O-antigen ligase
VATAAILKKAGSPTGRRTLAYAALVLFSFVYYARPEDFIPGLDIIPLGKITGGIALLALILGATGKKAGGKMPTEVRVLLLLLGQMILTIPFSAWKGGSFNVVFEKFSKGVIVALLISMIVGAMFELRRLLWVQAATVTAVTVLSVLVHHTVAGRLSGIQKGILENPNDLAINIAMNFPLCVAFMIGTRGMTKKAAWGLGLAFMMYGVVITYSRSGLLALIMSGLICLWEFGVKGRRFHLLVAAFIVFIVAAGVALSTRHYIQRIESLAEGNIKGSGDRNSLEMRRELLKESIMLALQHPIFGVGPGMFPVVTKLWLVAHNTYTELAAEAGFPALTLFLLALGGAFRNLRRVRKAPDYDRDAELRLWTGALWASMAGYVVGAMFASTEYNLFPYFMIAYTSALYRIAFTPKTAVRQPVSGTNLQNDGAGSKRELAWTR